MTERSPLKPISVISASAGTGKTYRLSHEYIDASKLVVDDHEHDSAGIVATTFTKKAAHELIERVRGLLFDHGDWHGAQGVLNGYLGTVNSICGRLLSEHAIDAGLSPELSVISEERLPAVFAMAVDEVIHDFVEELHEPAVRLQIENWRGDVQNIINLARNNDLSADTLEGLAKESWDRLSVLLAAPLETETADQLDNALAEAVDQVLTELQTTNDYAVKTRQNIEYLQEVNRKLKGGHFLLWQVWAKLAKMTGTKPHRDLMRRLNVPALAHARHPRLHSDLRTAIYGVFRCAAAAMKEYARFKREHGLIDFVDQEHLALKVLRLPEVQESLRGKFKVLLVDEFQDTSPLQLAVFLEMARQVDYSVWVGDEKQSIFGFRGSDPELMRQTVQSLVTSSGGNETRLIRSYRSRPSLIAFTNAAFSYCAQRMQIKAESARIEEVERMELAEQNNHLHLWWLHGAKIEEVHKSLAAGVIKTLQDSKNWLVLDRYTRQLRPLRGADIAILCRTNSSRLSISKALAAVGLTVATERANLLDTPECVLAIAALRVIIDDTDTLAVAEVVNMLLPESDGQWLSDWLEHGKQSVQSTLPCLAQLVAARPFLKDRAPSEVLELAIVRGGIVEASMSWGNTRQRLTNLDALRGLARTYEDVCSSAQMPATAAGLAVYLRKGVENGGHQPANPDENGIHVLTYHKSKGLEWPLVILYDLNNSGFGNAFGITVESQDPTQPIDPMNPLAGRSLRYWPWPYGLQQNDVPLEQAAGKTAENRLAKRRSVAENLRLLYVGMTRARDYLVMAARTNSYGTGWLSLLQDEYEQSLLTLSVPDAAGEAVLIDGVPESLARVELIKPEETTHEQSKPPKQDYVPGWALVSPKQSTEAAPLESQSPVQQKRPGYFLRPSSATINEVTMAQPAQTQVIKIGDRLPLSGTPDMRILGDCIHTFLAVDEVANTVESRVQMACQVLTNWSVDNISADNLVKAGDRLNNFVSKTYPSASWLKEYPVTGRLELRRVNGTIDLLLELEDQFVIIDHKSFPGRYEDWEKHALSYAPQLQLYSYLVSKVTKKAIAATYIHMPIVGSMIRVF